MSLPAMADAAGARAVFARFFVFFSFAPAPGDPAADAGCWYNAERRRRRGMNDIFGQKAC